MLFRLCPFVLGALAACGTAVPGGPDAGGIPTLPTPAGPDRVLAGASEDQARAFRIGDAFFEQVFTGFDGLGPVYVRPSCESCHLHAGRGPGTTQRMGLVSATTGQPGDPQSDMGLTTTLRPAELPNPDGLTDDLVPGVDLPDVQLAAAVAYLRLLDLPPRDAPDPAGSALFEAVGCARCHVPALRTRSDWPMSQLAGIAAPVFTDLLLHQMGPVLADGQAEEGAAPGEFRTAPLIGLRFLSSYLHDGRASTVEAAILGHQGAGSEASVAVGRFTALSPAARATLLAYLGSL